MLQLSTGIGSCALVQHLGVELSRTLLGIPLRATGIPGTKSPPRPSSNTSLCCFSTQVEYRFLHGQTCQTLCRRLLSKVDGTVMCTV